ncbi:hypothetical protein [Arthrobacter sp. BE255]|nr:hypothetical protein [Arthrobacter sp. BE255]
MNSGYATFGPLITPVTPGPGFLQGMAVRPVPCGPREPMLEV